MYAAAGYIVRKRPLHGSGADYLMTRIGDDANDFVRLEVSGTARGDALELRARLAQKRVQLREGRAVLAISAVSLWSAAGALPRAIGLADEFLGEPTLPTSERESLAKLAEDLRARAAQEHQHALLAELMDTWRRREPSGPDFDPDKLERVRIEAA